MKAQLFTRVTNREILTWIQKVSGTAPLIMVVGGYNGTHPLNDVEVISTQGTNRCAKPIRPILAGEVCDHLPNIYIFLKKGQK